MSDVHGYARRLANERKRVESADIPTSDRELIMAYFREIDAQLDLEPATVVNRIKEVRLAAERADQPLAAMSTLDDVNELLFDLKHDHELSDGTLRNYRKAFRLFFRWRGDEWADDIRVGASPDRSVDEEDVLDQSQVDELLEACDRTRDKALIAMMIDTGFRIGAAISLRVSDVDLSAHPPEITFNEDGPVKGASGTMLLTWSTSYLGNWLDIHPERSNEDAPLFYRTDSRSHRTDGSLSYQSAYHLIMQAAEAADLAWISPHTLRKTAITRWIGDDLTDQEIKHRAQWSRDSTQFKRYAGLADDPMNEQIAAKYGIAPEESDTEPSISACWACDAAIRTTGRFCPNCTAPLTQSAAAIAERTDERAKASLAAVAPEQAQAILNVIEVIDESTDVKDALEGLAPDHAESSS